MGVCQGVFAWAGGCDPITAMSEAQRLKDRLTELTSRPPEGIGAWSWDAVSAYKQAVLRARAVLAGKHANVHRMREAVGQLEVYWR